MKRAEIEVVFRRCGPMVLRRARAILGSDADAKDAAQEVFIKAFLNADVFREESMVSTWIYRITTNVCLNWLRARKRHDNLTAASAASAGHDTPARDVRASDLWERIFLRRILAEADEQWAQAAIYVYVDGMSHAEAARVLGVSKRTIGNLLGRLQRFADRFLEEEDRRSLPEHGSPAPLARP